MGRDKACVLQTLLYGSCWMEMVPAQSRWRRGLGERGELALECGMGEGGSSPKLRGWAGLDSIVSLPLPSVRPSAEEDALGRGRLQCGLLLCRPQERGTAIAHCRVPQMRPTETGRPFCGNSRLQRSVGFKGGKAPSLLILSFLLTGYVGPRVVLLPQRRGKANQI